MYKPKIEKKKSFYTPLHPRCPYQDVCSECLKNCGDCKYNPSNSNKRLRGLYWTSNDASAFREDIKKIMDEFPNYIITLKSM